MYDQQLGTGLKFRTPSTSPTPCKITLKQKIRREMPAPRNRTYRRILASCTEGSTAATTTLKTALTSYVNEYDEVTPLAYKALHRLEHRQAPLRPIYRLRWVWLIRPSLKARCSSCLNLRPARINPHHLHAFSLPPLLPQYGAQGLWNHSTTPRNTTLN